MEPKGSRPYSQMLSNNSYPEPYIFITIKHSTNKKLTTCYSLETLECCIELHVLTYIFIYLPCEQ